jgi:hypothetical protein
VSVTIVLNTNQVAVYTWYMHGKKKRECFNVTWGGVKNLPRVVRGVIRKVGLPL